MVEIEMVTEEMQAVPKLGSARGFLPEKMTQTKGRSKEE